MTNEQLQGRAQDLQRSARQIHNPMIPKAAKDAIAMAADIVAELVKREVERDASGER